MLQNLRTDKELDYASVISSYLWNMFRAKSPSTSKTTKLTIKSDVYLKPRKFPPTSSQLKELNESAIASDQCSLPKCLRKTNAPPGTYISSVLDSVSEIEDMDNMEEHKTINGIDQQKGEKGGGKPSGNQRSKEKFHQDSIIAQLDDVSSFERNILINSSDVTSTLYSSNVSTVSPEILELKSTTEDVKTTKNSFDDKSRNKSIILENEQNRLINKSSEFPSSSPLPSISISPSQSPSPSSSPSTSPSQPPPSSSTSSSLVATSNQSNASFVVQSQTSSSPLPVTFGIDQQRVLPTEFVHPTDGTFDTVKGTKTAAYRDPSASTTPLPTRNFADLPSADDINVTKANRGIFLGSFYKLY